MNCFFDWYRQSDSFLVLPWWFLYLNLQPKSTLKLVDITSRCLFIVEFKKMCTKFHVVIKLHWFTNKWFICCLIFLFVFFWNLVAAIVDSLALLRHLFTMFSSAISESWTTDLCFVVEQSHDITGRMVDMRISGIIYMTFKIICDFSSE